ncbi:MAG: UDP-N-acetylmuramoyl-tripeptide--D-alanyl-D-alanine ligase [Lentisphaerota bacterium]
MPCFKASDAAAWCGGTWICQDPPDAQGVSIDTRTLQPGQLYVALQGTRFDGHAYVARALAQGAAGAVVSIEFAMSHAGLVRLLGVRDTRQALMNLARGYRQSLNTRMVAVTGSVGKTTVKEMIADVMGIRKPTARSRGNWNNDIGLPLSLLALEPHYAYAVFELGMNHPGELAPLCRLLQPSYGVVTTIGPVHIEFFSSVMAIAEEKSEVLKHLPPEGCAVLSRDDAWCDLLRKAAPCRVLTTSLTSEADYRAQVDSDAAGPFTVFESSSGEHHELRLPLPGRHLVQDALYAVALGRLYGCSWPEIAEALAHFTPLPMRWNRATVNGVECINDAYNANPVSMRAAIKTFAALPSSGGKWLVLGGMRELGTTEREEHLALGRDLAAFSWKGLVTIGAMGQWIADGAESRGVSRHQIYRCAENKEAARLLRDRAVAGDQVLLKASRGEHLEDVVGAWSGGTT